MNFLQNILRSRDSGSYSVLTRLVVGTNRLKIEHLHCPIKIPFTIFHSREEVLFCLFLFSLFYLCFRVWITFKNWFTFLLCEVVKVSQMTNECKRTEEKFQRNVIEISTQRYQFRAYFHRKLQQNNLKVDHWI